MELSRMQESFFEDSKMKKENGELTPCYHWTKNEFSEFDPSTISNESGDNGYFGRGFYFTANKCFNSCCWLTPEEEASGKKQIQLECYLNIKNPFCIEKLDKYDKEDFLHYIKENSEYALDIVASDEDFVSYLTSQYYSDYSELIEQYNEGEIDFCDDEIDGVSLDKLYCKMERGGEIITPNNLTYEHIHRGLLADYSASITEYAKSKGFDGIISDNSNRPTEIVVFKPNQIKAVGNLYPTQSPNFKDNLPTLVRDFGGFYTNERVRIASLLPEYKGILSQSDFDALCDTIAKDPSPEVRKAMAEQGFTEKLQNDPFPIVREAVEKQREIQEIPFKKNEREKGIDI